MFDKNWSEGISPDRLRYEFSVFESDLLNTWKREYRYTHQLSLPKLLLVT